SVPVLLGETVHNRAYGGTLVFERLEERRSVRLVEGPCHEPIVARSSRRDQGVARLPAGGAPVRSRLSRSSASASRVASRRVSAANGPNEYAHARCRCYTGTPRLLPPAGGGVCLLD